MDEATTSNLTLVVILFNTLLLFGVIYWVSKYSDSIVRLVKVLIDAVNLINKK